jgi:hypothetical protein
VFVAKKPTKAELETDLKKALNELKASQAQVEKLTVRVAELGAGVPLPDSGSAATPSPGDLTCFVRVTARFIFEKRTFRPGMAVLSPSSALLQVGEGCWKWCDERTFRTADRRLHRTKQGWMSWQDRSEA